MTSVMPFTEDDTGNGAEAAEWAAPEKNGALEQSATTKSSLDFWARNPEGIPVDALFGNSGGAGVVG